MAIYKGNKKVVAVYKGSTPINKIYKGVTLVFQKSGGGGSTHLFEGTATGNFNLKINGHKNIPITPDADGKWFYDTDEKITSLVLAFYNQSAVTSVDLSNLDLTGISTKMMFSESSNIASIKFNNTKSMKLVDVINMFSGCHSLVSVDVSSFDTSSLTSIENLFAYCSSLVSVDLSSFDTSNISNARGLFNECSSLVSLDLSSVNTSNLQDAGFLFFKCTSLETLDLSNFDMSKATSYTNMFFYCDKLTHIKCKQAFKDWCASNKDTIALTNYSRINWEIVG